MSFLEPTQRFAIIEAVVHLVNRDFTALAGAAEALTLAFALAPTPALAPAATLAFAPAFAPVLAPTFALTIAPTLTLTFATTLTFALTSPPPAGLYVRLGFLPEGQDPAPIAAALEAALPDVLDASVSELNFKQSQLRQSAALPAAPPQPPSAPQPSPSASLPSLSVRRPRPGVALAHGSPLGSRAEPRPDPDPNPNPDPNQERHRPAG